MIFTTKSLIYTCAMAVIGLVFYYIFSLLGMTMVGIVITGVFALIGFSIATFSIPETNSVEITRKLGGEKIDKAFIKWYKFKKKKNVIYTYTEEKGGK